MTSKKVWQFPEDEHVDPRTDAEVARDEAESKKRSAKNKARTPKSK